MQPDEVEQMLYEHAIRTRIRAPFPERLSNLGYSRVFTSCMVAVAALVCSLVMSRSSRAGEGTALDSAMTHAELTDNNQPKQTGLHQPGSVSTPASLAMSQVGG